MRGWHNVGPMLVECPLLWPNIKPTLVSDTFTPNDIITRPKFTNDFCRLLRLWMSTTRGRYLGEPPVHMYRVIESRCDLNSPTVSFQVRVNLYNAGIFVWTMEIKGLFQFEILINFLVRSFHFISIPMLWVYDHYNVFVSFSAGTVCRRQNLTSIDVRFWRLLSDPALEGLTGGRRRYSSLGFESKAGCQSLSKETVAAGLGPRTNDKGMESVYWWCWYFGPTH